MRATDRFYSFEADFRDPFSRDRDRIIHCGSFRRLEYKTQVFLNHEGDYFRTRLTHSLEVSQIARTLGRSLGLNETLCEAIALAHDLGHTPFGHIGGDTLDELLKSDGRVNGFEHNFQSFRVLSKLEKRYKGFDGLNLTYATLEGVLKHSYPYKKPFFPEWIEEHFNLDRHPSMEAMVVDSADEIAYTSHDIDDGIKYGLIDFETLDDEPIIKRVVKMVKEEGIDRKDDIYRHRFVAALIKLLVEDFIKHSFAKVRKYHTKDEPLCSFIPADEPIPATFSKEIRFELKRLKSLLFKKLYRHEKIATKMYSGKECVKALYTAFNSDMDLLPESKKEMIKDENIKRVISDYIASMTDRYAMKIYHELYGYRL